VLPTEAIIQKARGAVWLRSGERLKRGFSMDEVQQLPEGQARWQKARKGLSWPE